MLVRSVVGPPGRPHGLDVVVLGVVPLMVFPSTGGVLTALAVATGVVWWRCARG